MYTYVFSTDCYSDYGINKIVKSKHKLDFAKLKHYQCVYGAEFGIDPDYVKALKTLDDYFLRRAHMASHGVDINDWNKVHEFERSDKYVEFNFVQWLVDNKIVTEVDYTEINFTEHEIDDFEDF